MSLLMEALRKAELEKNKAAQRLEQTVEHAQNAEETSSEKVSPPPRGSSESTSEQPITRLDPTVVRSREELLAATAQLSLTPIDTRSAGGQAVSRHDFSEDQTLNVLMEQITPESMADTLVDITAPKMEKTMKTAALSMAQEPEIGADSPLDESFHDAVIDISRELPGIFDETIQGEPYRSAEPERSYDETLPGVSAAELARDLGEENQPTPVAAQTIFTATATAQPSISYKWPLIIGLSVVVVIAISVIIYQSGTPLVREIPNDQLTQELDLSHSQVTVTAPPAVETAPAAVTASTPPAEQQATTAEAAKPVPEQAAAGQALQQEPPPGIQPVTAEVNQVSVTPPAVPAGANQAKSTDAIVLEPGLIKISRSKAPDNRGLLINDAYADYKNGDYAAANQKYTEVIKVLPDNRDALLGLGAIAMKQGDFARVEDIYSRLYRLDPTNKLARAILLNLDSQTDLVSRESTLKIMINDDPDNAFLYFTLGNIYAAQSRWAEAQQAFFDAYSKEATNADYALNLAISLDRIGQVKPALDYYHTALQLGDAQAGQFDSANILTRIQTLTGKASN